MDKILKSTTAVIGAFVTYAITKYHFTAIALAFLIFSMIMEQISWVKIIYQIKKENKELTGEKKIFKNPLHVSKLDIWMFLGVVMAIEIVVCLFTKRSCVLAVTCATMMYYSFMEIASFCVNQSMSGNKLIKILQKVANIFINAFDIAIETVVDRADNIASKENIEKVIDKMLDNKLKTITGEAQK